MHYSSRFGSLGEAADKAEGLAVLGFMFEVRSCRSSLCERLRTAVLGVCYAHRADWSEIDCEGSAAEAENC